NGDGSTTFRVPDFNGVQSGSIPGLFGRGDQGGLLPAGNVYESAAPDIAGTLNFRQVRAPAGELNNNLVGSGGAFSTSTGTTGQYGPISLNGTLATALQLLSFKASDSNPVYGRSANQVWPNSFVGVWIIRASGGFTAANTLWSVINEDAEAPGPGVLTRGGNVISSYKIAGVEVARGSLSVSHNTYSSGFRDVSAVIEAWSTDASASWSFNHAGFIKPNTPSGQFITQAEIGLSGGLFSNGDRFIAVGLRDQNTANADAVGKTWIMSLNGTSGLQFIARNRAQSNVGQLVINMPYSSGTLALQGTSGLAYKRDIKDADLA
ncbi:TPA: hypothetical protein U2L60_004744, partial [Citrobacter farmeri]|nr:hypothetical protein [Citrobacter farmeri]